MAISDGFRIYTNIGAFNALNALKSANRSLAKTQVKLATGLRINEAADDPAGFTISTRLQARSKGLSTALDNVGTASNALSIAEGGIQNISDILISIKEKVTQAASDILGTSERNAIKKEIDGLTEEIDDIVDETTFNNKKLIDGTYSNISIQTGESPGQKLSINIRKNLKSNSLNISSGNVSNRVFTATGSSAALSSVDSAIEEVTETIQDVGALNSRLSFKESSIQSTIVNTDATISRIRDADIARLQLQATRLFILQNTATAMLAQANLFPYSILSLINR